MTDALRELSTRECYARVYEYVRNQPRERRQGARAWLPHPSLASDADEDFVLGEVIYGALEWSYCDADECGVTMSEYARHGLQARHGPGFLHSDAFAESCRQSALRWRCALSG